MTGYSENIKDLAPLSNTDYTLCGSHQKWPKHCYQHLRPLDHHTLIPVHYFFCLSYLGVGLYPRLLKNKKGDLKVFSWTACMFTFFCWFYNFSYLLKSMQSTEVGFPWWSYNFSYPLKIMQCIEYITWRNAWLLRTLDQRNPKYHMFFGSLVIWKPHTSAMLDMPLGWQTLTVYFF